MTEVLAKLLGNRLYPRTFPHVLPPNQSTIPNAPDSRALWRDLELDLDRAAMVAAVSGGSRVVAFHSR